MTEREKPTGGKPAGLPDTGTEHIQILSHRPHERKIDCECSQPSQVCQCLEVPSEIVSGRLCRLCIGVSKSDYIFVIGKIRDTVIICESVISGEIIHQATGHAVAVVFYEDNFMPVIGLFRSQYPELNTIIAADNSYKDEVNTGLREANRAAKYYGCPMVIVPTVINNHHKFDFYDMAEELGVDGVLRAFDAASIPQEWGC